MYQQKSTPTEEEKVNARKLVIEKVPFTGTTISKITTTMDVASMVNSLFKDIFFDYEGSVLSPNPHNGMMDLSLFFRDKGENRDNSRFKNIVDNTSISREAKPFDRIRSLNIRNSNKIYTVTDETKKILTPYMNTNYRKPNVNWNQVVTEEIEPTYTGRHQVFVRVSGLSINSILKDVYGDTSESGSRIDYEIRLLRPLSMVEGHGNFLINITQLDVKDVENLYRKIGMIPIHGSIQMVKA